LLGGISCAQREKQALKEEQPLKDEQPLEVVSDLLQADVRLFSVIEAKKPVADHSYILAQSSDGEFTIRDAGSFTQAVREIASPEDALELVRLITSQELRPFLQDVYYAEVHKQANADDRWFAIEPKQ
jgi:hypothetical protein